MRQAWFVFRREFSAYFISPVAYIVISIFLLVTGWFFFATFFLFNQADLRNFFAMLPLIFSFVVPAITMRLFAEELNIGSWETLLTMPVTTVEVIVGKFAAAVAFVAAMLVPTLAYPASIALMGRLDWGPVVGGYLGAILLGAAFAAVGLFASSLTRSQIIAFIVGTAICFGLTLMGRILFFLPETAVGVVAYLGADHHFQSIAKGVVDTRDLLYFASLVFVALYATHLSIQEKD
jgi:ABC-2 type transport system permease protein